MRKLLTNKSGVYAIVNVMNQKMYIGSAATGIRKRWDLHVAQLHGQGHHSIKLQRAWNKHGPNAFEVVVLMLCPPSECVRYEQKFMDLIEPVYNISPTAGSSLGVKRSDEFKKKCSKSHKGLRHSEETRKKMSQAQSGSKSHLHGKPGLRRGKRSNTKLTTIQVVRIRRALAAGVTIKSLACKYSVHRETISRIKRNVTWTLAN